MSDNSSNTKDTAESITKPAKTRQNILKNVNQIEILKNQTRKKAVIKKLISEYHKSTEEYLDIQSKIEAITSKDHDEKINQVFNQKILLLQRFFAAFTDLSAKVNSTDAILTKKKLQREMKIDTYGLISKYYEELSCLLQQFTNALEVSAIKEVGEEEWNEIEPDLSDSQEIVDKIVQNMQDMSDFITDSIKKMCNEDEKQISTLSTELQQFIKEFTEQQGEIEILTYKGNVAQIQIKRLYDLNEFLKKEANSLKEKKFEQNQTEKEKQLKKEVVELDKQLKKINKNARRLEEYDGLEKGEAFQLSFEELINIRLRMICDELKTKLEEDL